MVTFSEYKTLEESFVKQAGTQYGSNPGGIHTHEPSGRKFYIKFPYNDEQSHVEAATAELYNHLGVKTLEPKVVDVDGKKGVASEWNADVSPMGSSSAFNDVVKDPSKAHQLALMHHAAVVTGNLDIVGLEYDNILKHTHTGDLVSVDQGGAMHFRAMGDQKDFSPSIHKELSGFQNPAYQSGRVFSQLPHEVLRTAAKSLDNLTDAKIDLTMKSHGLGHLANVVKTRRDLLKQHYAEN